MLVMGDSRVAVACLRDGACSLRRDPPRAAMPAATDLGSAAQT
jgi:hypothetical protein